MRHLFGLSSSEVASLAWGIGPLMIALVAARFLAKSRATVWLVSFAGAMGAMVANVVVDGQGAFLLLLYAPVIYVLATVGRRDLRH